jgi:hypothetical protein
MILLELDIIKVLMFEFPASVGVLSGQVRELRIPVLLLKVLQSGLVKALSALLDIGLNNSFGKF